MKRFALVLLLSFGLTCSVALTQTQAPPLYKDPRAPMDARVNDLISRMTLEEKISQLTNDSPAIDRFEIPAYNWWNEALHGVGRAGRATVFPQAIGIAASWDTNLMSQVATTISDEARAKYNEFVSRGKRNIYQGLTFWTPNMNLFRDPRWGRGMETYGEDPYLTGRLAVSFIKGMQGDDPTYFKTIATAKHFAVHSGPEPSRHTFDAVISEQDLRATYLPHFEAAIKEGGAFSVMCAYNSVDGQPACANTRLLGDILRKEWGFKGYVVSDCGAIGDIYLNHKFVSTAEQGVSKAIQAGTDLNCGVEYSNVLAAVKAGLLKETEINVSLHRVLLARFKLGVFDPPAMVKYSKIPYSENDSKAHRDLALETARKSIVLLKNQNNVLPLSKRLGTIAVIGPNADDAKTLLGNYNGIPTSTVTPLAGIKGAVSSSTKVVYARGTDVALNMPYLEVIPAVAFPGGLKGEYFSSTNFDGVAHRPAELTYPNSGKVVGKIPVDPKPVMTRVDPNVDFYWWAGSPSPRLPDDDFGVRWTGYLQMPQIPSSGGTYQLGAIGLNAYELYLDGKLIVKSSSIHGFNYQYSAVTLEAGKRYAIRLDYHEFVGDAGIQLVWSRTSDPRAEINALAAARSADAVVMVLGLTPRLEGEEMKVPVEGFEGGDRVMLGIPQVQEELLKKVVAIGKPTVLVLLNGSAVSVNWAKDNVPAIVEAWYPGQAGGTALADVLFGDYNPAGRLPVTFYKSADQIPAFTDYNMKGKTYRFFTGEPLFTFGYGLSYTTFGYGNLVMPKQVNVGDPVKVSVDVTNTGMRDGEEVVQLYVKGRAAQGEPIRSLEGFQRVALKVNQKKTVEFTLKPDQVSHVLENGRRAIDPGAMEISVGGQQPIPGAGNVVTGSFQLTGASKQLP
jgi:beta-glucosidase